MESGLLRGEEEASTERASELALRYSAFYGGKIEIIPKVPIRDLVDFTVWYTPGVAAVSKLIHRDQDSSFEYTSRWNTVAIVTDGSRVLGLGNIGPEAALPVMEGKALLFKYLGGVDAFPLPIDVHEPEKIIETVHALQPAFGGVNLEDIESPKCFHLLDRLRERMEIPVWHDDQQGTAGVVLAALINAAKLTQRNLKSSKIVLYGAGAANIAAARLLMAAGINPGNLIIIDTKGALNPEREDMDELLLKHPLKYDLALKTNRERVVGGLAEALAGADFLIAASRPGPGVIKAGDVSKMSRDAVVFALANPTPEIWPHEAEEAGAGIVATGRSDFPNQVNNSLLFPAIFRGVLDVRARTIPDEIVITAAEELAGFVEERGELSRKRIVPTMMEWEVYPRVASKVGEKAVALGLARRKLTREEISARATAIIERSKKLISTLADAKIINPPPKKAPSEGDSE